MIRVLDEHAPTSEARIPAAGIATFCAQLRWRVADGIAIGLVHQRSEGEGTDLDIEDLSGNLQAFWRRWGRGRASLEIHTLRSS